MARRLRLDRCSLSGKHGVTLNFYSHSARPTGAPLHGLVAAGSERSSDGNPNWVSVGGLHLYHESYVHSAGLAGTSDCQAECGDTNAGDALRELASFLDRTTVTGMVRFGTPCEV